MVDKLKNGTLYRLTEDVVNPAGDKRRNPNYEPMRDAPIVPKGRLFRAMSKRDWLLAQGHSDLALKYSEDPEAPVTHLQRVTSYDSLAIYSTDWDPSAAKLNRLFELVADNLAPAPDTFEVFLLEEHAHEGTMRAFLQWLTRESVTFVGTKENPHPVIPQERMIKLFRAFEHDRDLNSED
jgi:hypothetical protein